MLIYARRCSSTGYSARLVVVLRCCLLHFQRASRPRISRLRDVVVRTRALRAPGASGRRGSSTPARRESASPTRSARSVQPEAHGEAFGEAERVPQGGACRLVDGGLYAVAEVHLGQVAVVDVAGEDRLPRREGRRPSVRPQPTERSRWVRSVKDLWKAGQCSRSTSWRIDSPILAAGRPQAPAQTASLPASRWCRPGPRRKGSEVPKRRWSKSPVAFSSIQAHSSVVEHGAVAFLEYPSGARVHHDQAHPAEVAVVAPAACRRSRGRPCRRTRAGCGSGSSASRTLLEEIVFVQFLRGEVAEVLVDPVGHESPDDALLPPRLGAHLAHPGFRGVPVVVDVVVVEDHGRRHGREEPPDYRVLPGVPVQARVLLEVGDLLARRLARVAPRADELEGAHGDLVGVDLVP